MWIDYLVIPAVLENPLMFGDLNPIDPKMNKMKPLWIFEFRPARLCRSMKSLRVCVVTLFFKYSTENREAAWNHRPTVPWVCQKSGSIQQLDGGCHGGPAGYLYRPHHRRNPGEQSREDGEEENQWKQWHVNSWRVMSINNVAENLMQNLDILGVNLLCCVS